MIICILKTALKIILTEQVLKVYELVFEIIKFIFIYRLIVHVVPRVALAVVRVTVSAQNRGYLAALPLTPPSTVAVLAPHGPPTANLPGLTTRTAVGLPASQPRPPTANYPLPSIHYSDLWILGGEVGIRRRLVALLEFQRGVGDRRCLAMISTYSWLRI